jgi:cytochrome c-type biogenesis protein
VILLAADSVDTTVFAAFGVGIVSFLSPCVLPLVPGYLSAISGLEFAEIEAGKSRLKVLFPAILFCLSFTAMFVALGMSATGLGDTLGENRSTLREVSGVLIVLMGLFFIGTLFLPLLNREWRPEALMRRVATGGPVVAGLAFAVAWLPCTGPTLGVILTAAANEGTVGEGGVLLAVYSLGLAVPFLLSAVAFTQVTSLFRFFRNHYSVITAVGGVVLVVMGVLLYTNEMTELNAWLNQNGVNAISDL